MPRLFGQAFKHTESAFIAARPPTFAEIVSVLNSAPAAVDTWRLLTNFCYLEFDQKVLR
jgi:hypothetical protein